jgi:G3E family GTPase
LGDSPGRTNIRCEVSVSSNKGLPVTIVTGYLGAGKTTLVNNALRKANGLKLAILVNEFGSLAIDEDLIISQDENMISIAGGCVCCSYGNDLLLSLMELAKLDPKPNHIILEASGVAIPSAIETSISLIEECYVESIVALVDAEQIRDQLSDKYVADTILAQIQSADLIFANKIDLVKNLSDFNCWASNSPPLDSCICVSHSNIELDVLLGVKRVGESNPQGPHINEFWSKTYIPGAPLDPKAFAKLLSGSDLKLVRTKGYVKGTDGKTYLIQTVGHRYYIDLSAELKEPGVVLIGSKSSKHESEVLERIGELRKKSDV